MGDEAEALSNQCLESYIDELDRERIDEEHDSNRSEMVKRRSSNIRADVGASINCAYCNRRITKKARNQTFCGLKYKKKGKSTCKDAYHNYQAIGRKINGEYK